jgi:DNA-binding XRE family transcriptional regulator
MRYNTIMKRERYQRIQLAGKWYIIIAEDEFRALTKPQDAGPHSDGLDAFSVSDQRLADRLQQRRRQAGLTQKDLARLAGIRVETLNRIEKGHTTPDFKTIRKLVNAMSSINTFNQEVHYDHADK